MEVNQFVYLPDKGMYINLATVATFEPKRSNRIDYTYGGHDQLTAADAEILMETLRQNQPPIAYPVPPSVETPKPKRRGRPPKKKPDEVQVTPT